MAIKKATEVASIDVALLTVKRDTGDEFLVRTASKIDVSPQVEVTDAVKLINKGVLLAQKPALKTLTGNTITIKDNVFSPEVVELMQGGTITRDGGLTGKITGYTPPAVGEMATLKPFTLCAYTACYSAAGVITEYEKIEYPGCQADPIAFSSEDGAFRAPEYVINSYPDKGAAPYKLTYVAELPKVV